MASDISTSETSANKTASRLKLSKLLGTLYTAQREWEQRRRELAGKFAAKNVLRDLPQFQPEFCKGKLWPEWVKVLKAIWEGRSGIDELVEEYRNPPSRKVSSLRHYLAVEFASAEPWIEEQLGTFLWECVVERLITECAVEFDDLKELEDFEGHLRTYCESVVRGTLTKSGTTEFSRWIAGLESDFAEILLAEIWARFPRQCERLTLPTPKAAEVGNDGENYEGFASADTLAIRHGIRQSRLSEAASKGLVQKKRVKGITDSQGKDVRVMYKEDQAIKHCFVKSKALK